MSTLGTVLTLRRYPVKSMIGEELEAAQIGVGGIPGDRAYALIDPSTYRIGTNKIPRKWSPLLQCTPRFVSEPRPGDGLPPVRITLPDGVTVTSDQPDVNAILSRIFGFDVTLTSEKPPGLKLEHAAPGGDQIDFESTVDYPVINGFFDLGSLHLLTTATLNHYQSLYPTGRFDARRFRPNIVIQSPEDQTGFVEQGWDGKSLAVGDEVRLRILMPTARCVVTTLAQGDLPNDPGILRTAAQHGQATVGVYATVEREGVVRKGDPLAVID